MDYRDLSYFETIAQLGHLGLASEKLCRTQSALSKCIQRLEEDLDVQLFDRTGRRITLTPVGALLLERARIMRKTLEESKRQIVDFSKGITGHVRLGASTTMAELLLPSVMTRFLADAPNVTMDLKIGMNDMLRGHLDTEDIDLMLGPLDSQDASTIAYPIVDDEVVIVAAPDHPIFSGPLVLEELSRYRWILASSQVSTRRWLDSRLAQAGLAATSVQVQTNSILLLPQMIAQNQLLSLLSRRNLGPGRPGHPLQEVPIAGTTMKRTFGVVYRQDKPLSPAAQSLLNTLRNNDWGDYLKKNSAPAA